MSDDLSWGDLGVYGQEKIKTPNIDRIGTEGMRFIQAYSGASVCAPARSSLMQGLHQGNARVRGNSFRGYRETLQEGDYTVAMMDEAHTPSDVWISPGESEEEFQQRLQDIGAPERPNYISEY